MATMSGVEALMGRRVKVDANVFMYFLDGSTEWAPPATTVLTAAGDGAFAAVTGEEAVAADHDSLRQGPGDGPLTHPRADPPHGPRAGSGITLIPSRHGNDPSAVRSRDRGAPRDR